MDQHLRHHAENLLNENISQAKDVTQVERLTGSARLAVQRISKHDEAKGLRSSFMKYRPQLNDSWGNNLLRVKKGHKKG